MSAPRRGREGVGSGSDSGFTIIESVTAMGLFTVFVAVFVAAVTAFAGSIVDARASAEGASTNTTIVNTLDRQVRYAESINLPGPGATGLRYIEFLVPRSVTTTGIPGCYQWRYNPVSGLVEQRSWGVSSTNTAINIGSWQTKGSQVVDEGGAGYPFTMLPADISDGTLRQRLQITLSTGVDGGETSQTSTAFVARNSSSVSVTNIDANGDGQSDTKVCMQAGGRP